MLLKEQHCDKTDINDCLTCNYLLPSMDELAHLTLCPFMQHNSFLSTVRAHPLSCSPIETVRYCEPHAHPVALCCSSTVLGLSCPQTKSVYMVELQANGLFRFSFGIKLEGSRIQWHSLALQPSAFLCYLGRLSPHNDPWERSEIRHWFN